MFGGTAPDPHPGALLPDFVQGLLSGDEKKGVEAHLAGCEVCRERAEGLRVLFRRLAEGTVPDPPAGYFLSLLPRVRERIERGENRLWRPGSLVDRFAVPAVVGALTVLLLFTVPLVNGTKGFSNGRLADVLQQYDADALLEAVSDEGSVLASLPESDLPVDESLQELLVARELGGELAGGLMADAATFYGEGYQQLVEQLSEDEAGRLVALLSERTK
jgi:hypothetical protein